MYDEEEEKDDFTTKPTFEDAHKYKMKFTVLDPLNISGSRVDLDPLSFHFLEVIDVKVSYNFIKEASISNCEQLKKIYLSCNMLANFPKLDNTPQVELIHLDNNQLQFISLAHCSPPSS